MIFLTDTLTERMGVQPILPIKVSATIDTMLNFDVDFDGHNDVTCKQALFPSGGRLLRRAKTFFKC